MKTHTTESETHLQRIKVSARNIGSQEAAAIFQKVFPALLVVLLGVILYSAYNRHPVIVVPHSPTELNGKDEVTYTQKEKIYPGHGGKDMIWEGSSNTQWHVEAPAEELERIREEWQEKGMRIALMQLTHGKEDELIDGMLLKWDAAKNKWEESKDMRLKEDEIKNGLYRRWNSVKRSWEDMKDSLQEKREEIKDGALRKWNEGKGLWEDVKGDTRKAGEEMKEGLYRRWNAVKGVWEDVKEKVDEGIEDAKSKGEEWRHEAEQKWNAAKQKGMDAAQEGAEKVEEWKKKAEEKAVDTWEEGNKRAEEAEAKLKQAFFAAKKKIWDMLEELKHMFHGTSEKGKKIAQEQVEYMGEQADKAAELAKEKGKEAWEKAKEATKDAAAVGAEKAGEVWEKTKEVAKDAATIGAEKAGEAWEKAKVVAKEGTEALKEGAGRAIDAVKDTAGKIKEDFERKQALMMNEQEIHDTVEKIRLIRDLADQLLIQTKHGIVKYEDVQRIYGLYLEDGLDANRRADRIVEEVHKMGDPVVNLVLEKLEKEHGHRFFRRP